MKILKATSLVDLLVLFEQAVKDGYTLDTSTAPSAFMGSYSCPLVESDEAITVVSNEEGEVVAVTITDSEHQILRVVWERDKQISDNPWEGLLHSLEEEDDNVDGRKSEHQGDDTSEAGDSKDQQVGTNIQESLLTADKKSISSLSPSVQLESASEKKSEVETTTQLKQDTQKRGPGRPKLNK